MPRKASIRMDDKGHALAFYPSDRVDVKVGRDSHKVEMHIGGDRPGEGRYAALSPREARRLARELLGAADSAEYDDEAK